MCTTLLLCWAFPMLTLSLPWIFVFFEGSRNLLWETMWLCERSGQMPGLGENTAHRKLAPLYGHSLLQKPNRNHCPHLLCAFSSCLNMFLLMSEAKGEGERVTSLTSENHGSAASCLPTTGD
uniref:Secreted protein n=1 Tax=Myotis myotis TaxID=51298 RepID=A0A7J7V3C9_MYOMY|nr:hypothetical protein mMyoMyo1_008426 [Myotis myotis]